MTLKIMPDQIPKVWEAIKFAACKADAVDHPQEYLNEMLQALLSSKAQCFVDLDDDRQLNGLVVTRIEVDKISQQKFLRIQVLYMWKRLETEEWKDALELMRKFAETTGCSYITFNSGNAAIWRRVSLLGFQETSRTYSMEVGHGK